MNAHGIQIKWWKKGKYYNTNLWVITLTVLFFIVRKRRMRISSPVDGIKIEIIYNIIIVISFIISTNYPIKKIRTYIGTV